MLEFVTRAIRLRAETALGAAWAQWKAELHCPPHSSFYWDSWERLLLSSPLGAYVFIPMIQPYRNHLESFSPRIALRSYDPSSKCFTGSIYAVQSTWPTQFISSLKPYAFRNHFIPYKNQETLGSETLRISPRLPWSYGPEKEFEIKSLSCHSLNSFYLPMLPISSCLESANKHLWRWHHVPDVVPQARLQRV